MAENVTFFRRVPLILLGFETCGNGIIFALLGGAMKKLWTLFFLITVFWSMACGNGSRSESISGPSEDDRQQARRLFDHGNGKWLSGINLGSVQINDISEVGLTSAPSGEREIVIFYSHLDLTLHIQDMPFLINRRTRRIIELEQNGDTYFLCRYFTAVMVFYAKLSFVLEGRSTEDRQWRTVLHTDTKEITRRVDYAIGNSNLEYIKEHLADIQPLALGIY